MIPPMLVIRATREHQTGDIYRPRTQRHPDTKLAAAPRDAVRQDGKQANPRQQRRQAREMR